MTGRKCVAPEGHICEDALGLMFWDFHGLMQKVH